ncbi:MAG: DUF2520 domain-containing protein [Galbibacter orientalis]|uniref:Rossmann-like and DUF2520 domain-containing protein n=1 Tax=Galbibacter orientalis TaxID=453852 RepID=UPI003002F73A
MLKIVLIGGGNIAHHFFKVFSNHKSIDLIQCYNRNLDKIKSFEKSTIITNNLNELLEAAIYILAINDDAIPEFSNKLPFSNSLVVHTSGNVSMLDLNEKNRRGVFYPLQSFSKNKEIDFNEIPICIEAENKADLNILKVLAETISSKVFKISSEQRKILHVSAVFVNNFVNQLYYIGHDICEKHDIPFEILQPLIKETSKKIEEISPKEAQTGPAKRNDTETINSHLELLTNEDYKNIYKLLTAAIIKTHGRKKL